MDVRFTILSTLDETLRRVRELPKRVDLAGRIALGRASVEARDFLVETVKESTPRSDGPGTHLADTTEGDLIIGAGEVHIDVTQSKTVKVRGKDYPLAWLILDGHRGGYPINPTDKHALYWPGAEHPVSRIPEGKMPDVPGRDYITPAVQKAMPTILGMLADATAELSLWE